MTMRLTVCSPDGLLFQGEAASLSLRGAEGDLAVMAGHIPLVTTVQPGTVSIVLPDGESRRGELPGGILTVTGEEVLLLTGGIQWE